VDYKDILVYLDDGDSNAERIRTAFLFAKAHDAHLTGVTLAAIRPEHLKIKDEGAAATISEEEAQKRAAEFLELAGQENIPASARVIHGNGNEVSRKLAQYSRNFDLLILRQANPEDRNFALVEEVAQEVLLYSGRPIFFMPYIGAHHIPCEKAMIAWDGSPAVTRAVHDALPMLKQIGEVSILVVREGKKKTAKGETLVDDLAAHLERHDVNAEVRRVPAGTYDVQTVILNEIAETGTDLLVMGGYGTPSLKQKIFGGVTRSLLSSMLIPVFMSH
jgi:nucleotide-binding universal stress UspA family protein